MLPCELGSDWQFVKLIELVRWCEAVRQVSLWGRDGIRKYGWLSKHVHEILASHTRVAQDSRSTLARVGRQLLCVELVGLLRGHGRGW